MTESKAQNAKEGDVLTGKLTGYNHLSGVLGANITLETGEKLVVSFKGAVGVDELMLKGIFLRAEDISVCVTGNNAKGATKTLTAELA